MTNPILVTRAAGRVGGVGGLVGEALLRRGQPVRALVRREDERAEALRATGAEVVVADLIRPADVGRALAGCGRLILSAERMRGVSRALFDVMKDGPGKG